MSRTQDPFWVNVDAQLDHIEESRPSTAQQVIDVMNLYERPSSGQAFFAGSGGDRTLLGSLSKAGWFVYKIEAIYYWVAQHPDTKDLVTYIEGDVYIGDHMPDHEPV